MTPAATVVAARLRAVRVEELAGGHQSRVFLAERREGPPVVAKVFAGGPEDAVEVERRLALTASLADRHPAVCRPLRIGDDLLVPVVLDGRPGLLACFERADGRPPDPSDPADAARMGQALAALHGALRDVPPTGLPVVAALREAVLSGPTQLLHGDFGAGNLRVAADGTVRVFDLDDCGYGPALFDVANALYMVRFDDHVLGTTGASTFEAAFLAAYGTAVGAPVDRAAVERFVGLRVDALRGWLADLDGAPIGIRTSPPGWLEVLRGWVAACSRGR